MRSARLADRPPDPDAGFFVRLIHACDSSPSPLRSAFFTRFVCLLSLFIILISSKLVIRREAGSALMMKGVGAAAFLVYHSAYFFAQRHGCGDLLE